MRNTERMLNYGMYQMTDETGVPHHYLIETVRTSSSHSLREDGSGSLRRDSQHGQLFASQAGSLFEEFVD